MLGRMLAWSFQCSSFYQGFSREVLADGNGISCAFLMCIKQLWHEEIDWKSSYTIFYVNLADKLAQFISNKESTHITFPTSMPYCDITSPAICIAANVLQFVHLSVPKLFGSHKFHMVFFTSQVVFKRESAVCPWTLVSIDSTS